MKKKTRRISMTMSFLLMLSLILCPAVYATQAVSGSAILPVSTPGGLGIQVPLEGTVAPTIMSVTMPSTVMFDIGKNNPGDNKVLSPDVEIVNNSNQDVHILAANTYVDLYNMPGTVYAAGPSGSAINTTTGAITVQQNEIAIGVSDIPVTVGALGVPDLYSAVWFNTNYSSIPLIYVPATSSKTIHIVGTLGKAVPENSSFRIVPTLIASMYPY